MLKNGKISNSHQHKFDKTGAWDKPAFTLAEVLITLGIIGVVAAMTLPTLMNNIQNKHLETALKKSYSVISQVAIRVINEDFGGMVNARSSHELRNYFVKYYKGAQLCGGNITNAGCPPKDKAICTFMQQTYKTYNGASNAACVGNDALTNTIDGTTVYFDQPNWNAETPEPVANKLIIVIDVNGWQNRPNKLGHDMFAFELTAKRKLAPMGTEDTVFTEDVDCSLTSSAQTNGYGCTSKALYDKDYFKNLPK